MIFAVSNIAWPAEADDEALALLPSLGFNGLEIAPAKVFGDLRTVKEADLNAYRVRVEALDLSIIALQGIVFGVPNVHLFASKEQRDNLKTHLKHIAWIAGVLGAKACVFGAPTLRDPGTAPFDNAQKVAIEFLQDLAPVYREHGTTLCFEANPALYNCRFVTHTEQAFSLVNQVSDAGVKMQLDTGTIFANEESVDAIKEYVPQIGHWHISQPHLAAIGSTDDDHAALGKAYQASGYKGSVSIEMRATDNWTEALRQSAAVARQYYGESI
jgi:D-psicose/D-tagatose/L-ribulose 3-epimerase